MINPEKDTHLPVWLQQRFPNITRYWYKLPIWLRQVIKFGMVGFLNTVVDWGLYWLLTRGVPILQNAPVAAKAISYTGGVINSYFWNRNFTFRSTKKSFASFILFFSINLVAVGVNSGMMALGLHLFAGWEMGALLLATAFTLIWNFTTSKFLIFRP